MEKTILEANTILQDRYRLIRILGHGGMGAVYEAMDENLRCLVTVKETFATAQEVEIRKAFEREACLLANLRHPAFPKVIDYFEEDEGLFFVMDFIAGDDLAKALRIRGGPFQVQQVLGWAYTLLDALTELHDFNPPIVHKDIKPANLKLTPKGKIFLLDFGLAKGAAGQMTTVQGQDYSQIQGHTPYFASPEQIARKGTSPRSDLYSLAATLWCLLVGMPPPDAIERYDTINNGQPDPLDLACNLNPEVPPAIATILHQGMSLNRTQRPASAAEMRTMLQDAIEAPLRARAEQERKSLEEHIHNQGEIVGRQMAKEEFARHLETEHANHIFELQQIEAAHTTLLANTEKKLVQAQTELKLIREELAVHQAAENRNLDELKQGIKKLAAEKKLRRHTETTLVDERQLRIKREEAACYLEDTLHKTESALAAEQDKYRQAEHFINQLAILISNKNAELNKAREKVRLNELALHHAQEEKEQIKKERNSALKKLQLRTRAAAKSQSLKKPRDMPLIYTCVVALALMLGVVGLLKLLWTDDHPVESVLRVKVGAVESLEMIRMSGGSFLMGSPESDVELQTDEVPPHEVTMQSFYIGRYEITQAQWRAITKLPKVSIDLNEDPSYFKGYDLPVENVNWEEAQEFCARLSKSTGRTYRLPTEAEWEYATRSGATGTYTGDLDMIAWYADNSGKQHLAATPVWRSGIGFENYTKKLTENGCQTHSIGQKQANTSGLYDTIGNVGEWCLDDWHENYNEAPTDGSAWLNTGDSNLKIFRGGSWLQIAMGCRVAGRHKVDPNRRSYDIGFRVVATLQG